MKTVHLVCNAHLDPVWQWQWEEGAGEAVSTFRIAADFCDEFEGFVFNHNEAILYKWVEIFEPELFKRIQRLVKSGKWNITGGWFLQPDCNMPSGESFTRQILIGKNYFMEKFGVEPTTAINFDPFGHSRGLVQILKKSGYDSYVFCRPTQEDCPLPADDFIWEGFDGSEILGHRSAEWYNSYRGEAAGKIRKWISGHNERSADMILWGIGNHGGGPSRIDLEDIEKLKEETKDVSIMHSTPEKYFHELKRNRPDIPRHNKDLNSWAPGCYTSQARIKQKHRLLENEIYKAEKMLSSAAMQGLMQYPKKDMDEALYDLMTSQFHDILCGTCVQSVEDSSIRILDHGLEIVSRRKAEAFFSLCTGQEKAQEGDIPIFIYNPHPYKYTGVFECEIALPDINFKEEVSFPQVYSQGKLLPCQLEKEDGNVNVDWRKKAVFLAELEPSQINRFDCRIKVLPQKADIALKAANGSILFKTPELEVVINCATGLMDRYRVKGLDLLGKGAFMPVVMSDSDDPWEVYSDRFNLVEGNFGLMPPQEGSIFSGLRKNIPQSVRIVEDGNVRSIVEAVFCYNNSFICQRYKLPKSGTEIGIETRVHWNEKGKMLKLSVPTLLRNPKYIGQVAYGIQELPDDGKEAVSQKWTAVVSKEDGVAITCANDCTYGSDFMNGEFRISLLRSAGYAALPIEDRAVMADDRYSPRIDQGERIFNFWLNGDKYDKRLSEIDKEALFHNEKPDILPYFPSGKGIKPEALAVLSEDTIQLGAFKKAENSDDYIIRLFEPAGKKRTTILSLSAIGKEYKIDFNEFELKTFKLSLADHSLKEVNLMEK